MLIYFLFAPIIFFEYLHKYIFSAKYDKNYDPFIIKDTIHDNLPEPIFDMSILNDITVSVVITSTVFFYYVDLFYVFLFARVIRIICIFLLKLPNPYKNAHLERERCHDLIVSGHTISYTIVLLGANRWNILYTMIGSVILSQYFWYIIKKQHHYSLDVFLGIYVTLSGHVILTYFNLI
jgi:hypothetical protein